MSLWSFVIIFVLLNLTTSQLYDDQPKILVNDGNLILESAESKNISIKLNGRSRFLVNNIDILSSLNPSNVSNSNRQNTINAQAFQALASEIVKLKSVVRRQNIRIESLEIGGSGNVSSNASALVERQGIGRLRRRISSLEQRVANLTERLIRDYCKSYPCQNGGTCFNVFDTYRCECPENWEGPQCTNDVNECSKYVGTDLGCQNGATCINTLGSYECSCMDGWKGKNCNRRKVDCLSVPQMETCGHGSCIADNNKDGYSCICMQGWRKDNNSQACTQDVDECLEMKPHCSVDPPVLCINTPGSFVCGPCPTGYTGNGFYCIDINECEENNGGCSTTPKVECINTRGSFRCGSCPLGFEGDGKTCLPSSRPTPTSLKRRCTDTSLCNPNADCYQYPNSLPTCICKIGYTGSGYGENGCVQQAIDPCDHLWCKNGGTCVKNGTTAYCSCPSGTNPPLCDRTTNLCDPNPCRNGGNCTSTRFSSFIRCTCPRGFSGNRCQNQASTCGGVLNSLNGTLAFPTDPKAASYNHNSRCAWLIKTNHTKVLNITFQKFEIEFTTDCRYDWLQIHDGRTAASHLIGRFCGNMTRLPNGGNIMSTHNQLYLWFRSDNSTAHAGFELSWESITPECGKEMNVTGHGTISSPGAPGNYPINRDCEWKFLAPPGKRIQFLFYTLMIESHATCGFDYLEIHSGVGIETPSLGKYCNSSIPAPVLTPGNTATIHFHSDGDGSDAGFQIAYSVIEGIPGCGGIFTAPRGDLSSPTDIITGSYKNNLVCEYVIRMPKDSRVRVEFMKFNLEESATCKFDRVEIYEGSEMNDDDTLIGRYCGTQKPPVIISQTNVLTVRLTTDWSQSDDGFQMQYRLICGGIYTSDSGIIQSPNYPNNYEGDRSCEYEIIAPQGKVIVLNVIDFDIEQHSTCEFDYLQIFDGSTADNATRLGRFCGDKKPGIFTSTFNHMHIEFASDASVFGRGFKANYTFVDIECGGLIKDSKEIVKPPMDTATDVYKPNLQCRWLIQAPEGFVIQMNIINFDLELDTQCKYDYIKIFNNGSGNGDQIGPFCGSNAPKVITTIDNLATILFVTDSSTSKDGFTITFNFIESSRLCGGNFFTTRGKIRSPGTPAYLANKDCEWIITAPNGYQIQLNFNYFEMEAHEACKFDGLEIRNGGSKLAPLLGKFCGEKIPPPFKSMSNQLFLRFYSDSSRNGKGFEIEWDATTFGCGGVLSSAKGAIQSPNYPVSYPPNSQCEWRISVNEGSSIQIVFSDLDLEQHVECKYDFLEIFDGTDASAKSFGKFCSSEHHPIHIETSGNHAMIRMNTDESHSGRGFHIKYSANCNRTIESDTGIIESLNFPQDYPNNLDCAWTIKVSKGNRVNMQFSHFSLENDNLYHNETKEHICKYDYVTIYDYDYEAKEKKTQTLKTYCNTSPGIRNSTTDAVVVMIHTDPAAVSTGFRLEWYNEGCGGKLTHPSGSLTSPNYPRRYTNEITCIWEIAVEYGYNINLTVQNMEMEKSVSCEFDSLLIAHDRSFNNTIMKVCESTREPLVVTIDGHQAFVKFESDESHNEKGFNITYESIVSDCGGVFIATNGVIKTPSYPTKNYENNKYCEWKIKTDPAHRVTFQLTNFDIESSPNCTKDVLVIIDPIFNDVLFKGCGGFETLNITKFTSKRNELLVRLISDATINAKGFIGNFSVSCGSRIIANDTGEIIYRPTGDSSDCYWTFIAGDPSKHVTLTFTYSRIFFDMEMECFSRVHVYEGDVGSLGAERVKFCGSKIPPAIVSHGNSLTVYLNTTSMSSLSEFDIHYSVLDNACGGIYKNSIQGEFSSPNYPESSPLNTYCIWTISASAGNLLTLEIKDIDITTSENCNENYLEIRKVDANGDLVGLFCGKEVTKNLANARGYWIKYRTGDLSASNGFLAKFKYAAHSNLDGESGAIESPNYPYLQRGLVAYTYRISVTQGYVIRIDFKEFYMNEDDPEDCMSYLKIYNGYDETAPPLSDEICYEHTDALTSEANIVYIELHHSAFGKSRFRLEWSQVERNETAENFTMEGCGKEVISLNNVNEFINITSPGYPFGYNTTMDCEWTVVSGLTSYHPILQFIDVDLEDIVDCNGDYAKVSLSEPGNKWREAAKICQMDIRERRSFHGTPDVKLDFHSDYSQNATGFAAVTFLYCGSVFTSRDGIIEFDTMKNPGLRSQNCMWNITVSRGRKIKFEFLELNIKNLTGGCDGYVMIKNGHDDSAPYLGTGQYCVEKSVEIPMTSGNRAFVKYKSLSPFRHTFRLRYTEVQHECGGQVTLTSAYSSSIISSPNYPNIPNPHIECTWIVVAPAGERIRIDFLDRFDLILSDPCEKEFVELREGSTTAASLIETFCGSKNPPTKYTKSNVLRVKFFTDIPEPKNGFKANVSIGICGGTLRTSDIGYLTSPKYPGVGAYPSNMTCDYRIIGPINNLFTIKILDLDLPVETDEFDSNEAANKTCNLEKDHFKIYSIVPDGNSTNGESLMQLGTYCGSIIPAGVIMSESNEIVIKFRTFKKTSKLYRGFRLFYNASKLSCGGEINADSGFVTSVGYPSRTLTRAFCEWKITVTKGKRISLEFLDIDIINTGNRFAQRIGIYNDFNYSNRMLFITNSTSPGIIKSSDNKIMITSWIRMSSPNRGFKIKFTSDEDTVCFGDMNQLEGAIYPPPDMETVAFSCSYSRVRQPIIPSAPNTGTLAYYFTNLLVGKKLTNCRYAATVINVLRESGLRESDRYLGRICGNSTEKKIILSPFPDVRIEVKQSPYFGKVSFNLNYKTHKCGGIFRSGTQVITNLPADTANYAVLDCAWFVRYEEGFSVAITISKLNLKLPCDQEYIIIYNGPTPASPSLVKLCGNEFNSDQLLSQRESIFIEYHTENFVGSSKDSQFEIKAVTSSFGCGGILNQFTNKFSTPLYDKPYPANTECVWEIRADAGFRVGLKFTGRFYIEESVNCTKDYIEIHDFVDNEWKMLSRFCGRDTPKPINSTFTRLKVIFHSDETISGDGFNAEWEEVCGGVINVDKTTRILTSPKYPKNYAPGLFCNYTFVSTIPDAFVNIKFLDFDIESASGKCIYDNITLTRVMEYGMMDGKIGTFCGIINPGTFRYKEPMSLILRTDKWIERKGFQLQYNLDSCGGIITNSTVITSPKNLRSNIKNMWEYLGSLTCVWNITAPVDKKIVIKFDKIDLDYSEICSYDNVEIFKGKVDNDTFRLAKLCGNITVLPIVIDSNEAVIKLRTDQVRDNSGFVASVTFQQKCDENIILTKNNATYVIDKSNQQNANNLECTFKITAEPRSVIKLTFNQIHLSICDPDKPHDKKIPDNIWNCSCDYVEILNGNGPFSESIGRFCGHDIPNDVITTVPAAYVRFVTDSIRSSTGFKMTAQMIESPCGSKPYYNFSMYFNETFTIESPKSLNSVKYPPNMRCEWTIEAPIRRNFEISFSRFELEESDNCSSDSLRIEDSQISEYVLEGLGQEVIYKGKNSYTINPSFYMGVSGPNAPHIYCGSVIPHDYYSSSEKVKIMFTTNSENEYSGFKMDIKPISVCSRTFTALQGRIISDNNAESCQTSIKVPADYTISLYFYRFMFYQNDCEKAFMKVYDGDFENGALLNTLCGYTTPNPIFSTGNQLSIRVQYEKDATSFSRGMYDILYVASEKVKGPGCGGEIYNYGGMFSSPSYPSNNRTNFDCTWTVSVPQNLKMALKFAVFDMGSKLTCENDYVEILEENDSNEFVATKSYCGDDKPAVFIGSGSKIKVHYKQSVHFAGTGWMINFMGIHEGATPSEW